MQAPAIPNNEQERLATLRSYGILDTEAEASMDAIVKLTSELLGCRIALVSLVDVDRQWFKARIGLDAQQTSRDVSFCGHVVAGGTPVIVSNAHLDARFADNPLVVGEPRVIAYAGMPLRAHDGMVLGTLCAIDSEPREFTSAQQSVLRVLADQIEQLLRLRHTTLLLQAERRECAQYIRFFDLALDPICTVDDNLRFLKINAAWESTLGFSIEQLRCTPLLELIHDDDRQMASQRLSLLREGSVDHVRFDTRVRCNYGGEARLSWRIVRNDGVFFVTGHDITVDTRREAALLASREQLRTLFDEMEEGVVLQTSDGDIIENNAASERLLGLSADQLLGRSSIDERWHCVRADGSPFPGEEHPAMVVLRTQQPVSRVVMGVHKPDGSLTWIMINSRPVREPGAALMALTTFQDITEERRARDLARQLIAQERLTTTAKLASGVGAEVSSPLTSILTNAEQALLDLGDRDGAVADVLRDIRTGAERIRCILEGLSTLGNDVDLALRVPVDVSAVMQAAIEIAHQEVRRKASIVTTFEPTPRVLADEAMLTQVCVCLIVSATHHFEHEDPANNRIHVSVVAAGDHVRVRVVDNGSATGAILLPHIFAGDPVAAVDDEDLGQPGTHFGLAVARALVVSCGGSLDGHTTTSGGIELEVRLPLPREQHLDDVVNATAP
jgi:PAS domain S-box-containing protein